MLMMTLTLMMLNQSSQVCHFLVASPSKVIANDVPADGYGHDDEEIPHVEALKGQDEIVVFDLLDMPSDAVLGRGDDDAAVRYVQDLEPEKICQQAGR